MGKHTQDQFQTIKFVELQVGDIIVAKYQRKVYRPYFLVTDIKILKEDQRTPYQNMTMDMLGGREKIVVWDGIFVNGPYKENPTGFNFPDAPKVSKNNVLTIGYNLRLFETINNMQMHTGNLSCSLNKKKAERETLFIVPRNADDANQKNLSF